MGQGGGHWFLRQDGKEEVGGSSSNLAKLFDCGQTGGGDRVGSESGYSSGPDSGPQWSSPEPRHDFGHDKGAREGWRADLWEGKDCSMAGRSRREQIPSAAALAAGGRREGVAGCWEKGEHKTQGHILEFPGSETSREEVEQHGQPQLNQ